MLESRVERRLVDKFKDVGIELLKFKTPSRRDVPDRLGLLENATTIFVEVKRPGEELRKKQLLYCKDLCKKGYIVFVIDNTGMINELVTEAIRLSKRSNPIRYHETIRWYLHRDGTR